jgi:hypothetical protein
MGEGLVACGGGAGGDCMLCCGFDSDFQLERTGLPKGSFDDAESGRSMEVGLNGWNDCCAGEGSGFCPVKEGSSC